MYAPEPPPPAEYSELLGMKRFAFRATFFICFFGATAGFVRTQSLNGGYPGFWPVLGVLVFYALFALMQASWIERDAVAAKNRRLAEDYARDLEAAQASMPVKAWVRPHPNAELEPVRDKLKPPPLPATKPSTPSSPRPLLDATLGKTSGKR